MSKAAFSDPTNTATRFTAGIVKGLKEHGDVRQYFEEKASYGWHVAVAKNRGLIEFTEGSYRLTELGEAYYLKLSLQELPDRPAVFWQDLRESWEL